MDEQLTIIEDRPGHSPSVGRVGPTWKVLIADDEEEVHHATIFAFRNLEIQGRPIEFLHAYSAMQARALLAGCPDVAVILLDVVMESEDAGLQLVAHIREDLGMAAARIVLRTGQPGYAPELDVIQRYDINDYKTKSELTRTRLATTLTTAIRSYEQLQEIEAGRAGLDRIVQASAQMLALRGLREFSESLLAQVTDSLGLGTQGMVCSGRPAGAGRRESLRVLAATSAFLPRVGTGIDAQIGDAPAALVAKALGNRDHLLTEAALCLYFHDNDGKALAVYLETPRALTELETNLLRVFANHVAVGFQNVSLIGRLNNFAFVDPLCGLPNRLKLVEIMDEQIARGAKDYVLCLADLMQFSEINDALGHHQGDMLLVSVATRLRIGLPAEVAVARVGIDVFGLFGPASRLDPDAITEVFAPAFDAAGYSLQLSPALGIVRLEETQGSGIDALKNASIALNRGKTQRRQICHYTARMEADTRERVRLAQELRRALEQDRLVLHYQPQVDLKTGRVVGAEALLRWTTPDGVSVPPDVFIPVAEKSGMISLIGRRVLNMAGAQARTWRANGLAHFRMAVNVSPTEFRSPRFLEQVSAAVKEFGFAPGELELEITESIAMEDVKGVIAILNELKGLGVAVAIDDFGTGFSSLGYLQQLPVDRLKIDRQFVSELFIDGGRAGIPEMIIRLGKDLGLEVIAEGVETSAQAARLAALGCDEGQGYFYAKPLSPAAFTAWLAAHSPAV